MARSSTPFDASRRELLAARDARQEELARRRGIGGSLVALSLAVPGPQKTPPGAGALFEWALGELARALPGARRLHLRADALGPFAILAAPIPGPLAKASCVAIEASRPAARLLDLDVYSPGGVSCDRASLHLPPRSCLCCGEPAVDCIRLGRHGAAEVARRVAALLGGLVRP